MTTRPTTIAGTRRQSITTKSGIELERASIYMPADSWEALQRLCYAQGRSGSQVLQSLIALAALGTHSKDQQNVTSSTRNN